MDYSLLLQRVNEANVADEQFLSEYNALTVEVPKPVRISDLAQYADPVLTPKLLAAESLPDLQPNVLVTVKWALRLLDAPYPDFSMENEDFLFGLGVLINAGIFTMEEGDDLLKLGVYLTSQSMLDHGRPTTQIDLNVMRLQDKIAIARQKVANWQAALQSLELGQDVDIEGVA